MNLFSNVNVNEIVDYFLLDKLLPYEGDPTKAEIYIDLTHRYHFLSKKTNVGILNSILRKINNHFTNEISYNPFLYFDELILKNYRTEINSKLSNFISLNSLIILGIDVYPEEINNIITLEKLTISGNINNIPNSIENLYELKYLYLNNVPNLSTLPPTIENMLLKTIDIDKSNFQKIPKFIFKIKLLENLTITNSKINELPKISDLSKAFFLEELNLQNNLIQNIPKKKFYDFFEYKELNLDNNIFNNPCNEERIHKLDIEPFNENSTKSTIVLSIIAHGDDTHETISDYPTLLYYSAANKGEVYMDNFTIDTHFTTYLYEQLNKEKRKISDVIKEIEHQTSTESTTECNLSKIYSQTKKSSHMLGNVSDYNYSRQCELSSNLGLVSKVRHITNDRIYNIINEHNINNANSMYKLNKIYIVDIRHPKNENQTNYVNLCNVLNSGIVFNKHYVKLSDILRVCYNDYNFDNVVIVDFACRVLTGTRGYNYINSIELNDLYGKRANDLKEISLGRKKIQEYDKKNLGGRRRRKTYRRRKPGRKLKSIKKRFTKKCNK